MPLFGPPDILALQAKRDVRGLVKALDHDDRSIRQAAAAALGWIGDPQAVPALLMSLGKREHSSSYEEVIRALGNIGDLRAVEAISAYAVAKYSACDAAVSALAQIGLPAVGHLIAAFEKALQKRDELDQEGGRAGRIARILGEIGDSRAIQPLIAALEVTEVSVDNRKRRESIANGLAQIGDQRAMEPLLAAARQYWCSSAQLIPALERLGCSDEMLNPMRFARTGQWDKCVELGHAAVEPLVTLLKDNDGSLGDSVDGLCGALAAIGAPAVEPLIGVLEYRPARGWNTGGVPALAAHILGRIGDVRAVEPLVAALVDRSDAVRSSAAEALVKIGDPAVDRLCDALSDPGKDVREAVAKLLGEISAQRAGVSLRAALNDPFESVRHAAAGALARISLSTLAPTTASRELEAADVTKSPDGREALLAAFALHLAREAHVLAERPDLLRQQLLNRLQWHADPLPPVVAQEFGNRSNSHLRVWMRILAKPDESEALVRTLVGHSGEVTDCMFSADGRFIVSTSVDKTVRLWDPKTGRELRTLASYEDGVVACAVSPDFHFVVSASADSPLRLSDPETGATRRTLAGHHNILACAVSPDGRFIVSVGSEPLLRISKAENGEEMVAVLRENYETERGRAARWHNPSEITACAVSPDCALILTGEGGTREATGEVWDATSGRILARGVNGTGFAFGPDGILVASVSRSNKAILWAVREGTSSERSLEGHEASVNACAVTPDGRFVVSGSNDRMIKIWETATGKLSNTLVGHTGAVLACATSPDGLYVASGSADGTLKLWDPTIRDQARATFDHTGRISACGISPDGKFAYSVSDDQTLKLWDPDTGGLRQTLSHDDALVTVQHRNLALDDTTVRAFAICPDGRLVATATDHTLRVWNARNGAVLHEFKVLNCVSCAFDPEGTVLVSSDAYGNVSIWDVESAQLHGQCKYPSSYTPEYRAGGTTFGGLKRRKEWPCCFSPDGRLIVTNDSGVLKRLNAKSFQPLDEHECESRITSFALSPNSGPILYGCEDGTVGLWEPEKDPEARMLVRHDGAITAVAFSPDARFVVSSSDDHTLKVYDIESGRERPALVGHQGAVKTCAISPDGRFIVSTSSDRTLRLWESDSSRALATLPLAASAECLGLHPFQPRLFCGDEVGSVRLVDLVGVEYRSLIRTALDSDDGRLTVRCPACFEQHSVARDQLGQVIACPSVDCDTQLKINPFALASAK